MALLAAGVVALLTYHGESSRTAQGSNIPRPSQPLSKPEPSRLLSAPLLGLNATQKRQIEVIDREWQADKRRLLDAMNTSAPSRGRLDQVENQLSEYSRLSREYDWARSKFWLQAVGVLDSDQRAKVRL